MSFEYIPMLLLANDTGEISGALKDNGGSVFGSIFGAISLIFQFILLVAIFAGVVYLAYYSTKWIAKARNSISGTNLKVIESAVVGQQGTVQIIKAGSELYLIGVTKENITLLAKIDESSIELTADKPQMNMPFEKYYDKYIKKYFNNTGPKSK